jgi:hypothetical protein
VQQRAQGRIQWDAAQLPLHLAFRDMTAVVKKVLHTTPALLVGVQGMRLQGSVMHLTILYCVTHPPSGQHADDKLEEAGGGAEGAVKEDAACIQYRAGSGRGQGGP